MFRSEKLTYFRGQGLDMRSPSLFDSQMDFEMTSSPGQTLTTGLALGGKRRKKADGVLRLILVCLQNINFLCLNQNLKIYVYKE